VDINDLYFDILYRRFKESDTTVTPLHQPEVGITSKIIPTAIATADQMKHISVTNYKDLKANEKILKEYSLNLVKMHAGLGTSLERMDLIKKYDNRESLGAKGTDLFFEHEGEMKSVFEIDLRETRKLREKNIYKNVFYTALVNEETQKIIEEKSEGFEVLEIFQKKMKTLDSSGELTDKRLAPCGHGFVGVKFIYEILSRPKENLISSIGNGEDLKSTPDTKITSWMVENNIPVVMITTTKTQADKKGGQISIVDDEVPYLSIVEKAQAESHGQLDYFEKLGLRKGDSESLFNTNIALFNHAALKDIFSAYESDDEIKKLLIDASPDLIKNKKEDFIQLESALGSVLLNLDRNARRKFGRRVVHFLNLDNDDRENFFRPLKKREDYEEVSQNN
jgi:hypothetical protein